MRPKFQKRSALKLAGRIIPLEQLGGQKLRTIPQSEGLLPRDYLQKITDDKLYQIAYRCPNQYFPADLIGVKLDCPGS